MKNERKPQHNYYCGNYIDESPTAQSFQLARNLSLFSKGFQTPKAFGIEGMTLSGSYLHQ
jgi:hypothetical protein